MRGKCFTALCAAAAIYTCSLWVWGLTIQRPTNPEFVEFPVGVLPPKPLLVRPFWRVWRVAQMPLIYRHYRDRNPGWAAYDLALVNIWRDARTFTDLHPVGVELQPEK